MALTGSPSPHVLVERGFVTYRSPYGHIWSIPVAAIALVGRISVSLGGGAPDAFLVLAFRDLTWHAVPIETPGLARCLEELGALLGTRLTPPDDEGPPANEVVWPPSLAGTPVFTGERGGGGRRGSELSEQVVAFLSSGPVALGQVS